MGCGMVPRLEDAWRQERRSIDRIERLSERVSSPSAKACSSGPRHAAFVLCFVVGACQTHLFQCLFLNGLPPLGQVPIASRHYGEGHSILI